MGKTISQATQQLNFALARIEGLKTNVGQAVYSSKNRNIKQALSKTLVKLQEYSGNEGKITKLSQAIECYNDLKTSSPFNKLFNISERAKLRNDIKQLSESIGPELDGYATNVAELVKAETSKNTADTLTQLNSFSNRVEMVSQEIVNQINKGTADRTPPPTHQ